MTAIRVSGGHGAVLLVSTLLLALATTACASGPAAPTNTPAPVDTMTVATVAGTPTPLNTTRAALPGFLTPAASPRVASQSPATNAAPAPARTMVAPTMIQPTTGPVETIDAAGIFARVGPAVVTVINPARRGQGRTPPANSLGSGVIYDTQGHLLTNRSIAQGAQRLDVVLAGGKTIAGKVLGVDTLTDLAVVAIDAQAAPAVATMGDSGAMRAGQPVLALGSPFDFEESVTRGIISGTHRTVDDTSDLLQISAALAPGSSGGPVVNARGEVIGIATKTLRTGQSQRLGFAVPMNTARKLAGRIVMSGDVVRSALGATTETLTPTRAIELGLPFSEGAYITAITRGGAAEKAGFQQGDLLTALDAKPVTQASTLDDLLLDYAPRQSVTVTVTRAGAPRQATLTLIERPASGG